MNEQREAAPQGEPIPAIVGWMTPAPPLQVLIGGLFVYLINAVFEFLDRPLVAATFLVLAGLTIAIIPLEALLAALVARRPARDRGEQISRIYQTAIVSFVVGATLTVLIGAANALWPLVQLALVLFAAKLGGEIWLVALKRRIAKPR